MKDFFAKDAMLKIMSFVVSIIIWIYIIIVIDPSIDVTIRDIPIQYNEEYLTQQNLSIVNGVKPTVEVKVRGSRKKLANLDPEKILARVDLSGISKIGVQRTNISVNVVNENVQIISVRPDLIDLNIDRIIERRENIQIVNVGNLIEGFEIGDISLSNEAVLIKGASSLVNNVGRAIIYLNLDERKDDIITTEDVVLLDYNGDVINHDGISTDVGTVTIECSVLERKYVDVIVDFDGVLPDNMRYEVSPNMVAIGGKPDVIKDIKGISTEKISISRVEGETEYKVNLVIPDNVRMRGDITAVTIKAIPINAP